MPAVVAAVAVAGVVAVAALPATRWALWRQELNPVLRGLYERLRQAGKPPKLAFIAVARKLLTILNAIARDRTAWQG